MSPRILVYGIAYPNGNIYVGMELTGSINYFGNPSATARIGWRKGAPGRAQTPGVVSGDL